MRAVEVNFDGLVGPTHNYAGLSLGNRASMGNAGATSSPRRAARQGLGKMRRLLDLGLTQAVLPPHQRPDPLALESLGFSPDAPLAKVAAVAPALPAVLMSASPMWAANAATVSPSADTADGRLHLTPANLSSTTHRSFESSQTAAILGAMFADDERFVVHRPLPAASSFADEGAANHCRLAANHHEPGIHLFVFGREADEPAVDGGFPRRQTRLAGQLIANGHGLDPARVRFVRQADAAINTGAFHNDVVSVTNESVILAHEEAFAAGSAPLVDPELLSTILISVDSRSVPLQDAVSSYLFNSQLITLPTDSDTSQMVLIAPAEVEEIPSTARWVADAVADPSNPIAAVEPFDLRESMRNGGGPACLRLRVVMTDVERAALAGRVLLDHSMLDRLEQWVETHYRDQLQPEDLLDPSLVTESMQALDELTSILDLPGLYPFQR